MKKLTIILLALAVAVFFAGTALAFHEGDEGTSEGALGITGKYTMDGESYSDNAGNDNAWYDDDMEVVIRLNMQDVTGVIDLEVTDDESFDGSNVSNKTSDGDGALAVDNYWIEWQAMDNLKVKIGEFAYTFGKAVVIYADPAAHEIALTYSLDAADLTLALGKVAETGVADVDTDTITFLANVKGVDFFNKLNFIYVSGSDDAASEDFGYLGVDTAFAVGPVAVALEYGDVSDDDALNENSFILAQIGLDELVGFDLNIDYFSSGDDGDLAGRFGSGDFYPYRIVGWRDVGLDDDLNDMTLIGLSGSYKYSDKVKFFGKALVSGEFGPNDDAIGTEIDAGVTYTFADNVTGTFDFATMSPDDAYGANDDTMTDMRARFVFKF